MKSTPIQAWRLAIGLALCACLVFSPMLHAVCTLLVFAILRRLVAAPWPAFFGALLFAVHPIQTGKPKEAEAAYRQALRHKSDDTMAKKGLAQLGLTS